MSYNSRPRMQRYCNGTLECPYGEKAIRCMSDEQKCVEITFR